MSVVYVFLAILLLGVIVLVHELGHYTVGRLCGMGIEEFSIGFGPKLLGWRKNEIDYSIRAIPLGGYVHFTGEDEDNPAENALNNHPVWKRFLMVAAGAAMNFALAFVAILLLFGIYGYTYDLLPAIADVEAGSPAEAAGLMPGDRVLTVDGISISYDEQGHEEMFAMFDSRQDATPIELTVQRGGDVFDVTVVKEQQENGKWMMGVTVGMIRRIGFGEALRESGRTFAEMSTMMIDVLKNLIFRGEGADQVSGMVGTIGQTSQFIQQGFDMVLNLMAVISMNLGIMNLLPLPALDGGRLVFLAIEGIFRKPVPREKEGMVHAIGMILLIGLMILVTYSDIMKMIRG